jgi:hypothetical protein
MINEASRPTTARRASRPFGQQEQIRDREIDVFAGDGKEVLVRASNANASVRSGRNRVAVRIGYTESPIMEEMETNPSEPE